MGTTVQKVSSPSLQWSDDAVVDAFVDQFEGKTLFEAEEATSAAIDGLTEQQKLLAFPELAKRLTSEQLLGVAYGLAAAHLRDPDASAKLGELLAATLDMDDIAATMMRFLVATKDDLGNLINAVNLYGKGPSPPMCVPPEMVDAVTGTRQPFNEQLGIFMPSTSSAKEQRDRYVQETLPKAYAYPEDATTGVYRLTHAEPQLMAQPFINTYVGEHSHLMKAVDLDTKEQVYNFVSDALDLPRHDNDLDKKLAGNRAKIITSILERAGGFPIRVQIRPTVYTPPNEDSINAVFFDVRGTKDGGLITDTGGSFSGYVDFAAHLPDPKVDIVVAHGEDSRPDENGHAKGGMRLDEHGNVATVVHDARKHEPGLHTLRRVAELDQVLAVGGAAMVAGVAITGGPTTIGMGTALKVGLGATIAYPLAVLGYERADDKLNGRSISPLKRPELWWDYAGAGLALAGGGAALSRAGKPVMRAFNAANWGMVAATTGHIAMNFSELSPEERWRQAVIGTANAASAVLGPVVERQAAIRAEQATMRELDVLNLSEELIKPDLPMAKLSNDNIAERRRATTPPGILLPGDAAGTVPMHEFRIEGMPVPVGTHNRATAKFMQFMQFTWDAHFHKATAYSDAGGTPASPGIFGYTDQAQEGSVSFSRLADETGGMSSFVVQPIPQAMNKGCCPLQPYYLGAHVLDDGTRTLQPMEVYLKPGGIVHIPVDYSVIADNGMLGVLQAGDYRAVDLGFGTSRMPQFPRVGADKAYVNLIPNTTLPLDGSTRMRNMIDSVAQLFKDRPDLRERVSIGITSLSPRLANGAQELKNVMAYTLQAHDGVDIPFMGLGETNVFLKEAVETLVSLAGEEPHSMKNIDEFLGFMNDQLPGSAMVVHQDAGPPIEMGLPGTNNTPDRRLLVHGQIEYDTVGGTSADRIIQIAKKYPNVNIIWAHGGGISRSGSPGPQHVEMLRRVLSESNNVYIDMSWGEAANKIVAQNRDGATKGIWVGQGGKGIVNQFPMRFVYGSDEVGQNLKSYTGPLRKYFDGGFFKNMVEPELFLRGNAEHLVTTGVESFRTYMRQPEVRKELMEMDLTGAWKVPKIRERLKTPVDD